MIGSSTGAGLVSVTALAAGVGEATICGMLPAVEHAASNPNTIPHTNTM